ncbi:nitrile hydratase subunit beta [Amycolatopsis sp. NPDC004368]
MRNVHDVGGMLGYGAVPPGDGKTFHHDWEKLAFGLTLAAIANGFLNNVDENRYAKERMRPEDLIRCSYYELWLASLEMNLVENGVLTLEDIARREAELRTGHAAVQGQRTEPSHLGPAIDGLVSQGGDTSVEVGAPAVFSIGDVVVVDPPNTRQHSRVPTYACGRLATVTAVLGGFPLPQVVAHHLGPGADWCYQVRFEASALWGTGAEAPSDGVYLDVWEADLRPAPTNGQGVP